MLITSSSEYILSKKDVKNIGSDVINGGILPKLESDGSGACIPRFEDICYLVEMARERAYFTSPSNSLDFPYDTAYDRILPAFDGWDRTRCIHIIDEIADCIWDNDRHQRDYHNPSNDEKILLFSYRAGYSILRGVISETFDPPTGDMPLVFTHEGDDDYINDLFSRKDFVFARTIVDKTSVGTADSIRALFYDLSRMRRFVFSFRDNSFNAYRRTHEVLKTMLSNDYVGYASYGLCPPILVDDGSTVFHYSHLEDDEADEDGKVNGQHVVVDDDVTVGGYCTPWMQWDYSIYDPNVVAASYNEMPNLELGVMHYRFGYIYSSTWYDPKYRIFGDAITIMFKVEVNASWFESEEGAGDNGSVFGYFVFYAKTTGYRMPNRAYLLYGLVPALYEVDCMSTFRPACLSMKSVIEGRFPEMSTRPNQIKFNLTDAWVFTGDVTFNATIPTGWTWKPDDEHVEPISDVEG